MAWLGFALYTTGVTAAFGLRTWLHYRRTGDTGHRHSHPPAGSAAWWAQVLLAVALLGGFAAPLLAAVRVLPPAPALEHPALQTAGAAVAVLGFAGILLAQGAMGRSWRIGVDAAERTSLVTTGVFRLVRNPVFTAMITAMAGITAMNPSWLQIATLAALVVGIELQVRAVEEPYLRTTHDSAYAVYTRRTGRFLPLLGRSTR